MKALLCYICEGPEAEDVFGSRLPVGLAYLGAACSKDGHDCRVINLAPRGSPSACSLLDDFPARLFGATMYTFNRFAVLDAARRVKNKHPSCVVALGGPHAAALARELLETYSFVDAVATGEGEKTITALLGAVESDMSLSGVPGLAFRDNGRIVTTAADPIENLDSLASPAAFLLEAGYRGDDHTYLSASRGCRGHCTFCSSPSFWEKGLRLHGTEWLTRELLLRQNRAGRSFISFRDDSFASSRDRALELCRRLRTRDFHFLWDCQCRVDELDAELLGEMAKAGCRAVQLGVEHGSPRIQRLLGKTTDKKSVIRLSRQARALGIELSFYLITAIPGESPDDRRASRELVRASRPHDTVLSPLALYPGTALYKREAARRGLPGDFWLRTRSHWVLAMPRKKAETIMRREGEFLAEAAGKNLLSIEELRQARQRLDEPWPLSWALADRLIAAGRHEKAAAILSRALEKDSKYWLLRALALCLLELGKPTEALAAAEQAADFIPGCPGIIRLQARAQRRIGRKKQAKRLEQKARAIENSTAEPATAGKKPKQN